jgi:ERCC4-related helicase
MFKKDGEGSCRENRNQIYLAWDLKDAKSRWVGTGAYVEVYDFWWEINYEDTVEGITVSINETKDRTKEKIEMLGVKRVKNRHWGKK